jgi:uncharacterized protein (TIGR03437 family)
MTTLPLRLARLGLAAWAFLIAIPLHAQAPSGLTVKAASNQRVDLSWSGTASGYSVQRAILGGPFSNLATVSSATTYSDTTIDAYLTYQYQVVANLSSGASSPSNKVTAGPPPSGITNVAPAPLVGNTPSTTYGYDATVTLDANGDPAVAFLWDDPSATGDHTSTELLFRSWNRAQYSWNPVVKVAVTGDIADQGHLPCSLAYDTSTNTFAIATESNLPANPVVNINLYASTDGGATWTLKNSFSKDGSSLGPSLALARGNLYLAFETDTVGVTYVTGQFNQSPSTWTSKQNGTYPGAGLPNYTTGPSLALDSAGNPGIAYWALDGTGGYNGTLLYWKPAVSSAPVKITDSQNNGDGTAVKLAFSGLNPRVVMWVIRNDSAQGDRDGDGVHFANSEDGGNTWATPVLVPPDGNSTTDFPFDMALTSTDYAAVGFGQNGNYGDDSHKCGNPKLSLSSAPISSATTVFNTCSFADKSITGNFSVYPAGLQTIYGLNDKIYLLWLESSDTQANTGVLMYRDPPAGAITGPSITSVSDNASGRANIVAGSWVSIYGANLSNTTRTWSGNDFNDGSNLPLSLDGVSVKINGLAAAVYYISPSQINVQAPSPLTGSVPVQVTVNGTASNSITTNGVLNAPAFFTYAAGSKIYPAAVFPNGLIVGDPSLSGSIVSRAKAGDVIQFYVNGLGASPAGSIISNLINFPSAVTVTIGGAKASVQFAGLVASGEFQVNVIVPNLASGEYPIALTTNGQSTQSGVVIPIQ